MSGQLAQCCAAAEMRHCFAPPPLCPPTDQILPPPLIVPPALPPLLNTWSNPAVTYTRVTVEDLLGISTTGNHMARSSMQTPLNPLASPFQPGFQRPSLLQSNKNSFQAPLIKECTYRASGQLVRPTSAPSLGSSQSQPPNAYISRGTMYFGQLSYSSLNESRNEQFPEKLYNSLIPFSSQQESPQLENSKYQRDIAKMIWETEDLYDNALRVIRERRKEWKKERRKKRMKKGEPASSSSSSFSSLKRRKSGSKNFDESVVDTEAIIRNIFTHSNKRTSDIEEKSGKKPFVYLTRDRHSRFSIEQVEYEACHKEESVEEKNSKVPKKIRRVVEQTFTGKEVTVEEIADAILRMEADVLDSSLKLTRKTVINVIEQVQCYIIEELKLNPVDFISVRLHSASTSARLTLKAQERKPGGALGVRKIRLEGSVRIHQVEEKSDDFITRKYGILTYDGKEVTVEVIVKAIAKLVREIYGKRPPFKISRSGLSAFVTRKKAKILKALELYHYQPSSSDKMGSGHRTPKIEIPNNIIVSHKTKRKIKPIFMRRKQNSAETKEEKECSSSIGSKKSNEQIAPEMDKFIAEPTGEEAVSCSQLEVKESTQNQNESAHKLSSALLSQKTDRPFLSRRNTLFGKIEIHKNTRNPLTPRSYRAVSRRLNIIKSSPKKLRQTIIKMVSPQKKEESMSEENRIGRPGGKGVLRNMPRLADYLSVRGRLTAAPTSIVIRTIEKKAKKRNKKGWRKAWI